MNYNSIFEEVSTQSSSSIYNSLQTLMSVEQLIRQREEIMHHKDTFADMIPTDNIEELQLYGATDDEIEQINMINTYVKKGRDLLSKTLREYDICLDEIQQTEANIKITNNAMNNVRQQCESLSRIHNELDEMMSNFLTPLLEKQETITTELQTSIGLLVCKKDKLEATLKALGRTYNILKNAPMHHTCPICITHEVDVYLEPCGHTLCRHCNRSPYCHMCRTKIKGKKSLYYS
jgi:DNA repair ATPase RecN